MKEISVIIPCYNSGDYLPDAIASIKVYPDKDKYEIIIVDDGSTDQKTLALLDALKTQGCTVIHQENKGPAAARNTGVKLSKSDYLLFLDSDNKIRPLYIDKGIEVLNKFKNVGIVYGNPVFFGDTTEPRFYPRQYDVYRMFIGNYIDMCSVVRKKTWEELGGFDEEKILIGHEDWEFWIRVGTSKWEFHYINEILYDYRIRKDSLVSQAAQKEKYQQMINYLRLKHISLFVKLYVNLYKEYSLYQNDKKKPFRSFLKYMYNILTSKFSLCLY